MEKTKENLAKIIDSNGTEPIEPENPFAFTDVRNPMRKPSGIICQVKFVSRDDYLVFLATQDDVEEHGQKIYQECDQGLWGKVPIYVPTEEEFLVAAINQRSDLLVEASKKISDYQDLIDIDQATAADVAMQKEWKKYRVALNKLDTQNGWPRTIVWPKRPE